MFSVRDIPSSEYRDTLVKFQTNPKCMKTKLNKSQVIDEKLLVEKLEIGSTIIGAVAIRDPIKRHADKTIKLIRDAGI
jgi:magnesium-transporting ATPase (P-type)